MSRPLARGAKQKQKQKNVGRARARRTPLESECVLMGGRDGCGFSAGPGGGRALLRHTRARATPARAASMSAGQAVKVFAQPAKKVIHHTHISVTKVRARWPCRARELARSLERSVLFGARRLTARLPPSAPRRRSPWAWASA